MSSLNNKDIVIEQMEAIAVSFYIQEYSIFEEKLKQFYASKVSVLDNPVIYYYCGSVNVKKNIQLNIEKDSVSFHEYKFYNIEKNYINYFTLKEIITIDKAYNISKDFFDDKTINSFHYRLNYSFFDACTKAINMRNRLAHEMNKLSINQDKDVIELLDKQTLVNSFNSKFLNFDLNLMNDDTTCILSNIYYIRELSNIIDF